MISYRPFWETLKRKGVSTYVLINHYGMSSNRFTRMRKNLPLSTTSIDDFCRILDCGVEDIMEYIPDEQKDGV